MSRRWPTARTSTVAVVSTKIARQSPTRNRAPGRPVRRLTLPAPVLANRSILASMSARTSGGSLRNSRRASWVHENRLHESNISIRDDLGQRNIAIRDIIRNSRSRAHRRSENASERPYSIVAPESAASSAQIGACAVMNLAKSGLIPPSHPKPSRSPPIWAVPRPGKPRNPAASQAWRWR